MRKAVIANPTSVAEGLSSSPTSPDFRTPVPGSGAGVVFGDFREAWFAYPLALSIMPADYSTQHEW
jgi:hypothetical protein